jgi:hypothetical protein
MANGNDNGAFGFARRMMASAGLRPEDVPEPSLNLMRSRDRLESALEEGGEPGERFMMFEPRSEDPSDFRTERSERLSGLVQDLARARSDRLEAQAEQQEKAAEQATNMLVANLAPQLAQSFTGVDLGAAERSQQQQQRARQARQRAEKAEVEAEAQQDIMELEADLEAGRIEAEDQARAEKRARQNEQFNFEQLQTAADQYNQMAQNAQSARQKRRFQELAMASDIALAQMKTGQEDSEGILGEDAQDTIGEFGGLVTSGVRAMDDLFPEGDVTANNFLGFGGSEVPQSTLNTLKSTNTKNRLRKLADDLNRAMGKMESKGLVGIVNQDKWQAAQSLHNSLRRIAAGAGSETETDKSARQTLINAQDAYRQVVEAGVPTESRILGRLDQMRQALRNRTDNDEGGGGGGETNGGGQSQVSPDVFDQY